MLRTAAIWEAFNKLEQQKEAVLSRVVSWPQGRLLFRDEPNSWSTLDVVDHLARVEKSSLTAIQSSLPDGHRVAFKNRLGALVVLLVMRSPMRIKVPPSASAVHPSTKADLSSVAEDWSLTRVNLRNLIESLSAEQLRSGLFQHPVSGWMTMTGAINFLSAHMRHHEFQFARLEKASVASR